MEGRFEDRKIVEVSKLADGGWSVTFDDGWSFFIPNDSPVAPTVGMTARLYGKGIGFSVRGLLLDGQEVFYRTELQQEIFQNESQYGADATEWLRRWDEGSTVWSIEMGGLGPGYEQAIQITVAEALRILLEKKPDASRWGSKEEWEKDREVVEDAMFKNPIISKLGLSRAQWGAALSVAAALYKQGPITLLSDERYKERHIQVSKNFPQG